MRKVIGAGLILASLSGMFTGPAPAQAATVRTLSSGVYATPAARNLALPSYVPVAQPGTYKTSGRPASKVCALRAVDMAGVTVANSILMNAKSGTVKVPASAVLIEISGPCKWRR